MPGTPYAPMAHTARWRGYLRYAAPFHAHQGHHTKPLLNYRIGYGITRWFYSCIAPVISIVLYFSYHERWNVPTSLHELVKIPLGLEDFVQEYKIHVTGVAWLPEEELRKNAGLTSA